MGAGFRTAKAQFVDDKMLKLPYQLMESVIMQSDARADEGVAAINALGQAELNSVDADKTLANELVRGIEERVGKITESIHKDPLNYSRYMKDIRGYGRELDREMREGKWAGIQDRYDQLQAYKKQIAELKEADGYDAAYKNKLMQEAESNMGDLGWKGPNQYNKFQAIDHYALGDLNEKMKTWMDDAKERGDLKVREGSDGMFIWRSENGVENYVDKNRLMQIAMNSMSADTNFRHALKQRQDFGLMENVIDANGNPILFQEEPVLDAEGNQMMDKDGNPMFTSNFARNPLASAFAAGLDKYSGGNVIDKHSNQGADPYGLDKEKRERDKQNEIEKDLANNPQLTAIEDVQYTRQLSNIENSEQLGEQAVQVMGEFKGTVNEALTFANEFSEEKITEDRILSLAAANDWNSIREALGDEVYGQYGNKIKQQYRKHVVTRAAEERVNAYAAQHNVSRDEAAKAVLSAQQYADAPVEFSWEDYIRSGKLTSTGVEKIQSDIAAGNYVADAMFRDENGNLVPLAPMLQSNQVKIEYKKNIDPADKKEFEELTAEKERLREEGRTNEFTAEQRTRLRELKNEIVEAEKPSYVFKNGGKYVNFEFNESTVKPGESLDDNGKPIFQFEANVGGRTITGIIPADKVTTGSVQQFLKENQSSMQFRQWLNKNEHLGEIGYKESGYTFDNDTKSLLFWNEDGTELMKRVFIFGDTEDAKAARILAMRLYGFTTD